MLPETLPVNRRISQSPTATQSPERRWRGMLNITMDSSTYALPPNDPMKQCALACLCLFIACCGSPAIGIAGRQTEQPESRAVATADQSGQSACEDAIKRRAHIVSELRSLTLPPWAGEYSVSRGSLYMAVAPTAGLVIEQGRNHSAHRSCAHGSIIERDPNRIEVTFDGPTDDMYYYYFGRREPVVSAHIVFVHIHTWIFAVPLNRAVDFCNHINANDGDLIMSLRSSFLSRQCGDTVMGVDQIATVAEQLPFEFRKYVMDQPVAGHVVELIEPNAPFGVYIDGVARYKTTVSVDIGTNDGLTAGMTLYLHGVRGYGAGEIVDCEPARSHVAFVHTERVNAPPGSLTTGASVSTIAPNMRARRK